MEDSKIREFERTGVFTIEDLQEYGAIPPKEILESGKRIAIIECLQEIPCDSCLDACKRGAIEMKDVNAIPKEIFDACSGCQLCIRRCPGLAIFMVKVIDKSKAEVTMPYELSPLPSVKEEVVLLNRVGKEVSRGIVRRVIPPERNDNTAIVTVETPRDLMMEVRAIRV